MYVQAHLKHCHKIPTCIWRVFYIHQYLSSKRGGILKLSTKTVKLTSKTLGFIEIEDNHQNVGWEFAKRNNKGENSNFLLN
jgi:hypothetical protein